MNTLEKYINYLASFVNERGGHAHKNHALKTSNGDFVKNSGEPWDYEFFSRDNLYCFDAKETHSKSINLKSFLRNKSNLKQFNNFNAVSSLSPFYVCGFLVWFAHEIDYGLRFFNINLILNFLKSGQKSISINDGELFHPLRLVKLCINSSPAFLYPLRHFVFLP